MTTTIKLSAATRDALQALKGKRSYDELLGLFLQLVPEGDGDGKFTPEFRLSLLEGLVYNGPRVSFDQLKGEFGL